MEPGFKNIIVVGAGPAGLLLSLMLAQKSVPVTLLDLGDGLDPSPRALHYSAPAHHELLRAGVVNDVKAEGSMPQRMSWRKLDGTRIAGTDSRVLGDDSPDRTLRLSLDKLGAILLRHLKLQKSATILFNHRVTDIGQDGGNAWVDVETNEGMKRMAASYVVGCDGGNSQVRKCLFPNRAFPGRTWDEQIVATNTYYDFDKFGWDDINYIIDQEHWFMASRISNDGLWRVSYGEKSGLTREELLARQADKFKKMLPGHPSPEEYRITNFSPYRVHQRLAESFKVGRFLLAGDAAHLCNPFGGLGLTGGIVDVGNLYDCLIGIYANRATDDILVKYSEVRRDLYSNVIDTISSSNMRRMFASPETVTETDDFFKLCKRAETDTDLACQLQRRTNAIKYDFTQHYFDEPMGEKKRRDSGV